MTTMAKRIKAAIDEKGLTHEAVARALGIRRAAVTQWLSGETKPSRENLFRFARLVDRAVSWIVEGDSRSELEARVMSGFDAADEEGREEIARVAQREARRAAAKQQ